MKRRVVIVALAMAALTVGLGAAASAAAAQTAPGSPGTESYFDLARKDCVGTARNTTSKVWFTVADGVLSDVYWPTVDATNVHTLQYLVTDGKSFTDLQTRDMTYRVMPDPTGMSCTIVASSAAHHYRLTTTYVADPSRDAVLMRTSFSGPASDQVYVRLDPLAGGTGGGGLQNAGPNTANLATVNGQPVPVASNTNTTTNAVNRDYAVPTFEALESSRGFSDASVGYAGTSSDGLQMLDSAHQLTSYDYAPDGHVALTAELNLKPGRTADLALGFGQTQAQALGVAGAATGQSFALAKSLYERGWQRYDGGLRRPSSSLGRAAVREYYESVNVVKASEDKTYPGAIAAGLASPWGQAVPAGNLTNGQPTYFGSYREVFARDLYEAFTGLLVAGDVQTARAATRFLFDRQQQSDGSMPRNSLTNGKPAPDTGGLQLDETSYPILMDWQSGLGGNRALYRKHVIPAADFLVAHGPSDGVERWEEQSGYSPSTIAAEIAGLTAAANIAAMHGDAARSRVYQATADDFARNIKSWTVTDSGPYTSIAPSYFIRIAKNADPNSGDSVDLGNGSITVDQRSLIDAGFLDLVRLGVLPASDPTVRDSLKVVDDTIEVETPSGPGFYRYGTSGTGSEDGYGDCYEPDPTSCSPTGAPWPTTDTGSGHLWPVLDGERGEYDVAAGSSLAARRLLTAMRNMTSGQGLEPEQVWEDPALPASPYGSDPTTASIGFSPGHPAGSASPLTWAQAQYARLALDLSAGRNLETPSIVSDRYVRHGMPGSLPVTVTSPAPNSSVTSASVPVTGTTTAGAEGGRGGGRVHRRHRGGGLDHRRLVGQLHPVGAFGLRLDHDHGHGDAGRQHRLHPAVGHRRGAARHPGVVGHRSDRRRQRPRDLRLSDGVGLPPGAFDLTGMKVSETADDVYIQVSLADLTPTFGSNFGAQLLDVYVRNPAATRHLHAGCLRVPQLHDCPGRRLERAARGPGLRSRRMAGRLGRHPRLGPAGGRPTEQDGHPDRAARGLRGCGLGLGVHRHPDRPGRLQLRSGPRVHRHPGGVLVRRVPHVDRHQPDLLGPSGRRAQDHGHDPAVECLPGHRAEPDVRVRW